jgi:hypothetical protein
MVLFSETKNVVENSEQTNSKNRTHGKGFTIKINNESILIRIPSKLVIFYKANQTKGNNGFAPNC